MKETKLNTHLKLLDAFYKTKAHLPQTKILVFLVKTLTVIQTFKISLLEERVDNS